MQGAYILTMRLCLVSQSKHLRYDCDPDVLSIYAIIKPAIGLEVYYDGKNPALEWVPYCVAVMLQKS